MISERKGILKGTRRLVLSIWIHTLRRGKEGVHVRANSKGPNYKEKKTRIAKEESSRKKC